MISISGSGWAEFKYKDFIGYCSYLTDVPTDILKGCLAYLDTYSCSNPPIFFDEEGSEFCLIIGYHKSVIIAERKTTEVYIIDMDYGTLIEELVSDIESAGSWNWAAEFAVDTKDIEEIEYDISRLLKEVKEKLKEETERKNTIKEIFGSDL